MDLKAQIMQITNAHYPGTYKETNMTKPEYTPTPWRIGDEYPATVFAGSDRGATLVCQCDPHDKFSPVSEANAALIVSAVNAHEALVEIAQAINRPFLLVSDELKAKARAALKLATH